MEKNTGGVVTVVALIVVIACVILVANRADREEPNPTVVDTESTTRVETNVSVETDYPQESGASEPTDASKSFERNEVHEPPFGITERVAWTESRVVGSPDPPPPLRTRVSFPKLQRFKNPTVISSAPGTDRLFVAEHAGKIYSFEPDEAVTKADLFLDVADLVKAETNKNPDGLVSGLVAVYGLTFHPDFANNRQCYVCYVVNGKSGQLEGGTRVARFTVSKDGIPICDASSEQMVITWLQGGHNGGCIKFGKDGKLFISTGDGGFANPPDGRDSGQDVSNLLSCVLRIDVDSPDEGKAYSIPKDNPFVDLDKARGEIWAYGFRNPWKISVDRETGDLWVGDVGWELWELIYRVERGGNYGWSIVEGRQSVHPERTHGPTPILPPTVELPHTDGVSVTGGFVYRGKKFPELVGQYIFGDWETRRIWGVKWDGKSASPRQDLVPATVRVVGFAENHDGELYVLDYSDGTVHDFVRNDVAAVETPFPTKLSETGLFTQLSSQHPAAGVLPFSVNAEQWMDHATAERFIGVPESGTITVRSATSRVPGSMFQRGMDFPSNTVLAKTISIETEVGNPDSIRPIETQVLHWDGYTFQGYSYAWNESQTDAELVERRGKDVDIPIVGTDGKDTVRKWHFPSRMECARCHNPWAEYTLAFNLRQLNRDHNYGDVRDNQLRTLEHIGVLKFADGTNDKPIQMADREELTNPHDESAELDARARAYLHVNCAHCHRNGGGGSAYIELQAEKPLDKTGAFDVRPTQGTFGIQNARILAPSDPLRSVLYYRMSKLGRGRMPHIGSEVVDERGARLIHDWIRQLSMHSGVYSKIATLRDLDEATAALQEEAGRVARIKRLAKTIAREAKHEDPTTEDQAAAIANDTAAVTARQAKRKEDRTKLVEELLTTIKSSMALSQVMRDKPLPRTVSEEIVAASQVNSNPLIRDLFVHFVPAQNRPKTLGSVVDPQQILALAGDTNRGRELFAGNGTQCKNCHKLNDIGKPLGPDLAKLAKTQRAEQVLESILKPSKRIDPKYTTHVVITLAGKSYAGLLASRTDNEVVLKNSKNEEIRLKTEDIDEMVTQRVSLMPDLQVKDMTAQQVSDLLAFLMSFKNSPATSETN